MTVNQKLCFDYKGLCEHGAINIVIFGDSVSHGAINGYIDYENVYWNRLRKKLNAVRDYTPINMICSAIGGASAKGSLPRLERDVLSHHPDLVIVCFGLNDVNGTLEDYIASLREIFTRCQASGLDVIFMTPNMLNTYVAEDTPKQFYEYAAKTARMQNEGRMDRYVAAAIALCEELSVRVCDCYARWKALSESGTDTTLLLANRINHPTPEMHALFAESLFEILIESDSEDMTDEHTMYRG